MYWLRDGSPGASPARGRSPLSTIDLLSLVQVYWLRDGERVDAGRDVNVIISHSGNLLISQVRLSDAANYTCVAQNVASRRLSEPAMLTVYGILYTSYVVA